MKSNLKELGMLLRDCLMPARQGLSKLDSSLALTMKKHGNIPLSFDNTKCEDRHDIWRG